ncbi:hypothetical protein C8F01DRAFT_284449 [Mycena amicta]|nr:hypothetical protein C8F01DRAFT_284449 [Mycena amicta]
MQLDELAHEISEIGTELEEDFDSLSILFDLKDGHPSESVLRPPVVYPILSLPYDVVCELFLAMLHARNPARLRSTSAPLLLMHVCKQWRTLVLSMPALWANLEIVLRPVAQQGSLPGDFSRWITCICPSPRNLRLTGWATGREAQHMLAILHHHRERLQTLSLHVGTVDPRVMISPLALPALTTVDIGRFRTIKFQGQSTKKLCFAAFRDLPALREVTLKCLASGTSWGLQLPHSQLTVFTAEGLTLVDCLRVLSHAVNLNKCTFLSINNTASMSLRAPLIHNSLKELVLSSSPSTLLSFDLRFPALSSLSLTSDHGFTSHISNFISKCATSLLHLEFSVQSAGARHLISPITPTALRNLENLTVLTLRGLTATVALPILYALDVHTSARFLPLLRQLHMKQSSLILDDAVVLALRSRFECAVNLSVTLIWTHVPKYGEDRSHVDWQGLKKLVRDGMNLHLIDSVSGDDG